MKIAHVVSGKPGPEGAEGVRQFAFFMARALAKLGHEVALFSLTHENVDPIPGVFTRAFLPSPVPFRVPRDLLSELERWRADILHLHSPYFPPNFTLARWARRSGTPYVVTPHGALSPGQIRQRWPLKLPYKFLCEIPTLNQAAFVHAVGATEDLRAYGVRSKVELAPCGIDLSIVPAQLNRKLLSERHPMLSGRRIFLFLGRLDPPQKGLDLLVRAFGAFADFETAGADAIDAALVVVGPDYRGGRHKLERLVDQLRPAKPVLFLDPVFGRERFDVLAGADVFVCTSRWEGMPLAVLEAAALEIPCLLTPPSDPFGRLSKGGGAISVAPAASAIADGLRRFQRTSSEELRRMGKLARKTVATEFPWERGAQLLSDAYVRHTRKSCLRNAQG